MGKKVEWTTLLLATFLILILRITPSMAATDYIYLNIPGIKQEQSNWCWAATSRSVIEYLNKGTPSQTTIVTTVKGSPVNEGATFDEDRTSLTSLNVSTTAISGTLSWDSIKFYTKSWMSPTKATIFWTSGGGHDLVIYGYYEDSYAKNVSYMDPWPSNQTWNSMSYSPFLSNSNWTWKWTFYANK